MALSLKPTTRDSRSQRSVWSLVRLESCLESLTRVAPWPRSGRYWPPPAWPQVGRTATDRSAPASRRGHDETWATVRQVPRDPASHGRVWRQRASTVTSVAVGRSRTFDTPIGDFSESNCTPSGHHSEAESRPGHVRTKRRGSTFRGLRRGLSWRPVIVPFPAVGIRIAAAVGIQEAPSAKNSSHKSKRRKPVAWSVFGTPASGHRWCYPLAVSSRCVAFSQQSVPLMRSSGCGTGLGQLVFGRMQYPLPPQQRGTCMTVVANRARRQRGSRTACLCAKSLVLRRGIRVWQFRPGSTANQLELDSATFLVQPQK
jgi:hypothetical protein